MRRRSMIAATAGAALGTPAWLAGCASFNQLSAEVSTFGEWPQGKAPGTYAFERLPSQQAQAELQQRLEDAARPALEKHGFRPVADGREPDLVVQLGARVTRADRSPWDDPLWWPGVGFGYSRWRYGPWRGPYWGASWRYEPARYDREVAVLVRDRQTGRPLFEARASSEGNYAGTEALLRPLFDAALFDFPATGVNPRQVRVPLS